MIHAHYFWIVLITVGHVGICSAAGLAHSPVENRLSVKNCSQSGPLSCNIKPVKNLLEQACAQLVACLTGRKIDEAQIVGILSCETVVVFKASTIPKVAQTAVVTAEIDLEGTGLWGTYLFTNTRQGWCLSDQILSPAWNHGGYCEIKTNLKALKKIQQTI